MNYPRIIPCVMEKQGGKTCWLDAVENNNTQALMQDDILICKECSTFKDIISRGFGRRTADQTLGSTIAKLLHVVADRSARLNQAREELEIKVEELALMKIITDAVVKTNDMPKALRIILTGVTSGGAFGFNRAGIFLVDQRNEFLVGRQAVGPDNSEQAERIWSQLQLLTFEQQINNILEYPDIERDKIHELIEQIKISLTDSNNIFIQALMAERPTFFKKHDLAPEMIEKIQKYFDFNEFVAVPLRAEGQIMGLMIADNYYTHKPITDSSIVALETLANTCTSVLEKTILHEQLSERFKELEHVNKLLRENQNYLIQTERLADIGKLATTVAHEFKTPLVTIGGYTRRALRNVGTSKFNKRDLEIISSEVKRLEIITAEILEYSRQSKLKTEPHSINKLVRDALSILKDKFSTRGIKLKMVFDGQNPRASLDERRFVQVIYNLVDNAFDAMKPGMTLRIATRADSEFVILEIQDNGSGIADEYHDKLYTPFFTTKSKGSGLGLAVSKKIIDDHGGRIEFETAMGKGTKFSILFPKID